MFAFLRRIRSVLLAVLVLQVLTPVSSAAMRAASLSHDTAICSSGNVISADARAATQLLLFLAGEPSPEDDCARHCMSGILVGAYSFPFLLFFKANR